MNKVLLFPIPVAKAVTAVVIDVAVDDCKVVVMGLELLLADPTVVIVDGCKVVVMELKLLIVDCIVVVTVVEPAEAVALLEVLPVDVVGVDSL